MYHFISGFTSRVAGTEVGVTEPQPTFSACFGGPFMAHRPNVYAKLLAEKMEKHHARCILLNTGWSGGSYGTGQRMKLSVKRALLNRSEEHTSELQSLMRISYAVFCLKKKNKQN